MTDFNDVFANFLSTLTNQQPDEALMAINEWLPNQKQYLEETKVKQSEEVKERSIVSLAGRFPIILHEKELHGYKKPKFEHEEYIKYLKTLGKSYQYLPNPNCKIAEAKDVIPDFDSNWIIFEKEQVKEFILSRDQTGYDFYGCTYGLLQKAVTKSEAFLSTITFYFNSIVTNNFPLGESWCTACVKAVFKGGDQTDPARFRPLVVLPLLVRVVDGILSRKIHNMCLVSDELVNKKIQKAIIKNSSGLWENTYKVNRKILEELVVKKSKKMFLFLDLKNAFGSVNYGIMEKILERKNFSPQLTQYFRRYYTLVVGTYKKQRFVWNNGLLQGSALSNILFLIYIDTVIRNVFEDFKSLNLDSEMEQNAFAFVDDLCLELERDEKDKDRFELFELILSLYNLELNHQKTYFLTADPEEKEIQFGHYTIKRVKPEFQYLGSYLYYYQSEMMDIIYNKVKKALITIESFPIDSEIKNYLFYQTLFLRLSRHIECYYLLNGMTPELDKLLALERYFVYRFGIKGIDFSEKARNYLYSKGMYKVERMNQITDTKVHDITEELKQKYQVSSIYTQKEVEYSKMFLINRPTMENMKLALKSLRDIDTIPKEHFKKVTHSFYGNNFVELIN